MKRGKKHEDSQIDKKKARERGNESKKSLKRQNKFIGFIGNVQRFDPFGSVKIESERKIMKRKLMHKSDENMELEKKNEKRKKWAFAKEMKEVFDIFERIAT